MALFSHFDGRIGRIEIVESQKGNFLSMSVATDIYSQGEVKTMWIRVRSNLEKHMKWAEKAKKGSLIHVEGTQVEPNVWEKDGTAHAQIVILANVISYVTGSGKKKDKPEEEQTPVSEELPIAPPAPDDQPEDLPF